MSRAADPDTHARRRAQLVDAVFRIVHREGIEQVSVRTVAQEAGMSMGTLRHYFGTQAELLTVSLGEVEQRLRRRIAEVTATGTPRQRLEAVARLLVPMTDVSRVEHEIWLAFVSKATVDPALRRLNEQVHTGVHGLLAGLLAPVLAPGADLDAQTERLHGLLDGLAMHATLWPQHTSPARLGELIHAHLDSIDTTRPGWPAALR